MSNYSHKCEHCKRVVKLHRDNHLCPEKQVAKDCAATMNLAAIIVILACVAVVLLPYVRG